MGDHHTTQKTRRRNRKGSASHEQENAKDTHPKKVNANAFIALALIIAGLGVLLYPVIATQWNNAKQTKAAEEYSKLEKSVPQKVLDTAWKEAHHYNYTLRDISVGDAWTTDDDENSPAFQRYQKYLSVLSESETMGRIIIPSIKSDLPIFHGTGDKALSRGVGHLFGTDLPVGGTGKGQGRHAALSAHTGYQTATLWDNLDKLKKGDAFYIQVAGKKLKYKIHSIDVVDPKDTSSLHRAPGRDLITLITCTPYGINTHRLMVTGHQVSLEPEDSEVFNGVGSKWQWWMWVIIAAATTILTLLLWWWRRNFGRRQMVAVNTTH